jgi:hypothetical protein
MKKIGIAVFALMFAGVSYLGAQEVEIDFDGKSDIQDVQNMDRTIIAEGFQDIGYNAYSPNKKISHEIDNKSKVGPKSLSAGIRGLNPYQKIKFLENIIFSSKGHVVSFYGKDIQDVLGKDRLEAAKNTLFGLKNEKENKSQNGLKKSFKGFDDSEDEEDDDTCGGVPDSICVGNGTCKSRMGYWCSPCACK